MSNSQVSDQLSSFMNSGARLCEDLRRRLRAPEPHDPDYALFGHFADEGGTFVDVGANFGLSVASLRLFNRRMAAVSFEPLPWMEPALQLLKEVEGARFEYHMVALGEHDGTLTMEVPTVDRVPNFFRASGRSGKFANPGSQANLRASLKRDGPIAVVPVTVPVRRLDGFDLAPTIIKIDVEGLELAVLRGAARTIERHRPLILLELSANKAEIIETMDQADYGCFAYANDRLTPANAATKATNVIFVANEKVADFRNVNGMQFDLG